MTSESDSIRLARIEEKFDALLERLEERHLLTTRDLERCQGDICSLKDDRAKTVGAALVVGTIMGAIGGTVMKWWPFSGH